MLHTLRRRTAAFFLALSLLVLPAQALTVQEAGQLLQDYYIDDVPQDVLNQPTIDAMLDALGDRYTTYFTPGEYAAFLSGMQDVQLTGIGVKLQLTDDGPTVHSVLDGSPALSAGLKSGDIITAVDGTPTAGMAMDALSSLIQGEAGSTVQITYRRGGTESTCTLTRSPITVAATTSSLLEDHIGYLSCTTFGPETYTHFQEALEQCAGADRWIVDLRNNGGGLTQAAIDTLGVFTGSGIKGYLATGGIGQLSSFQSKAEPMTDAPVIVLVDEGTASASELFSSGIRDLKAGLIVGGRTFGKGVAQSIFDQDTDPELFSGDAMKITTARFYSSGGSTTDTIGVIPHLLVSPDVARQVALLLSESQPEGNFSGYLRLDLNGSWYLSIEKALETPEAFSQLLTAIPPTASLWMGAASSWVQVEPHSIASAYSVPFQSRSFTDVSSSPYADAIQRLAAYGIVLGDGKGSYLPAATLTRAQLATLLAQALNCTIPTGESLFSDVSMDTKYGQAINAIARMGLVEGTGNGRFRPDDTITHEQYITIMGRLAQRLSLTFQIARQGATSEALSEPALQPFSDWSRLSVWLLTESQLDDNDAPISLLWSDLSAIDPKSPVTREEAADLLCAVLEHTGILPA